MCIQSRCIVLAQCHSAAKRRGLLPFGGRFVAEIFVQNFKWRVSQGGADVSYILIPLLLLYLKNLLSYTAWHNYFQAFIAVQILPSHICIMRVYTIPLYCTCSVLQRCKKTRVASLRRPFSIRNIYQKFKMTGVSERDRPQLYCDTNCITVSQKLAESYSSAYFYPALLFAVEIFPNHVLIMRVYTMPIVLFLVSITALQKDEGCFPSATVLYTEIFVKNLKWRGVSERGRRKLYFDPTFVTVSQKRRWYRFRAPYFCEYCDYLKTL